MKEYEHNKKHFPEAVGFSKEEHKEMTNQIEKILKALAGGKGKKSKAVERVEKIIKGNNSRQNAYVLTLTIEFFDNQIKEVAARAFIGSSFLGKEDKQKDKKQELPDDVKRGYI
jgi:hypothetical protein